MHRFGLSIALTGIVALLALPAVAADNGFYLGARCALAPACLADHLHPFRRGDVSGDGQNVFGVDDSGHRPDVTAIEL